MEYQIRREDEEAWILVRVKLLPKEQGNGDQNLNTEFGRLAAESNEAGSNGQRRKLGAERLRREILNYCVKPRSRKEIAAQFGFSTPDYVIQKYVLPMVRSRMIQMTIPDRPRSKNQKYFSIQIPQDEE